MRKNILCCILLLPMFHTVCAVGWFKKVIQRRFEQRQCERRMRATSRLHDAIILNDKHGMKEWLQSGATTGGFIEGYAVEKLLEDEDLRLKLFQPLVYSRRMKEREADAECEIFSDLEL